MVLATEAMVSPNATTKDLGVSSLGYPSLTRHVANAKGMYDMAVAGQLFRLESGDCIRDYATTFQTTQRRVILITANDSSVPYYSEYDNFRGIESCGRYPNPFAWVCGSEQQCGQSSDACIQVASKLNPENWTALGSKVAYCLSEQPEQKCSVEFSLQLAIVVMVCNLTKLMALLYAFLFVKDNPLLTPGDAIASFLQREDETTRGMPLMGKAEIAWWQHGAAVLGSVPAKNPTVFWLFRRSRKRWHQAVSRARWWTCLIM